MNEITIDCVIFGFDRGSLEVLLVEQGEGTGMIKWGLPSGLIKREESTDNAAHRLLEEFRMFDNIFLEQLKAFGDPNRFPLRRVITIGYYALVNREKYNVNASFTTSHAKWYKIKDIPDLIYDHNEILAFSLKQLRNRVRQAPIGFNLLPEKFTLLELLHLYEEILGVATDKSNFRRKILSKKLLLPLDEEQQNVSHRAAKLYKFDSKVYEKLTQKGFSFDF
ncbi:NUDIX hydrolase [Flavobacterium gawalongense]|nr:NUDIX domain-containing protein [Flavobacterium gawalongense]